MITANWRVKCNVDCPYCEETIDLLNYKDSFEWLPAPGMDKELEQEINCPKCKRTFTVQNVEHY